MAEIKECPMCLEVMRFSRREVTESVPGTGQRITRNVREWVCPDCDYWEEAEDGEGNEPSGRRA